MNDGIHLREGFFFKRTDSGIKISYQPGGAPDPIAEIVVPDNEWASVMATTSARGETHETWLEACAFLGGKL